MSLNLYFIIFMTIVFIIFDVISSTSILAIHSLYLVENTINIDINLILDFQLEYSIK